MTGLASGTWGALFDWDGVIVDSSRLHEAAWDAVAREHGYPHGHGDFERHFGSKNERAILEILKWTADAEEARSISARKEVLYRELLGESGDIVLESSRRFVEALLDRRVPRAVVSSSPRLNIEVVLERAGMQRLFDAVVAAEDVSLGKPDPGAYRLGAERLGLPAARCVVFEDAPAGLEAGRRAGARTVALCTTHPAASLRADLVVSTLALERLPEVEQLIGRS